ncbi:MAG: diguanylate cyclase [bacterium]|nr:diguanylate cyclase [bacterium]MDT8365862.1 diguanylate cyclase [bacterium]
MTASRTTSLPKLINRLLELPPCEDSRSREDLYNTLVNILGETVEADAFAILQLHPGRGAARILGGSGLRTAADKRPEKLKTPQLAERAANFPHVPALVVKGPFADDPFLNREGVRYLLFKTVSVGKVFMVTAALRRENRSFTPREVEKFAAVSGVISLLASSSSSKEEPDPSGSTDKLTGLGLFSEFHETMVNELSRARRGGGTVAMGIMSVISRESVSKDEALLDVIRTFQSHLRNFDTLVRYSSMMLAFILPDLRSAEGVRVLDRVTGEIISSLGGDGIAPEIYVGLSCYPEDGATVERLIEMAEAAMNQALEEGTPGVSRWEE